MERSEMEKNLEQLKHSLATGEMTGSELVRRLQMMIQQEISKPEKEVDTEFIEACSSLIEHVYPAIAERPEGYYEEQAAKFKVRLQQREKARQRQRILRPVIAVAAVLVIVFLSIGSIRFHWFTMKSTPDQQQLIVQGHEVSVDMVAKAIAEHQKKGQLETNDLNELSRFLGFSLNHLDLQDYGWTIRNTWTYILANSIMTTIQYCDNLEQNSEVIYRISWFIDSESARLSIRQNETGYGKIIAGKNIHCIQNYDSNVYIWDEDMTIHRISSLLSEDKMDEFLEILINRSD